MEAVLEEAMDSDNGIEVEFTSRRTATSFRSRCYSYRHTQRRQSEQQFEPDEPGYGQSDFDELVITLREEDGKWIVRLEKSSNRRPPGLLQVRKL